MTQLDHFRAGGFDWSARPDFREGVEALCRHLDDPGKLEGAVAIKASLARAVWRVPHRGCNVFVKRYHVRGLSERIKYLFATPRARAEWRAAVALRELGFEAAEPLAVGVRRRGIWLEDGFFAAAEVPGEPLPTLLEDLRKRESGVTPLLRAVAELPARFEAAGVYHPDLHIGNMLARVEDSQPRIALFDLHAVRFPGPLARLLAPRMRAKLAHSLTTLLNAAEREQTLQLLAPGKELALSQAVERLERVRLRSRSKRCVTPSSVFTLDRVDGWRVWRRREVPLERLRALIRAGHTGVAKLEVGGALRDVSVQRRGSPSWLPTWKGLHALGVREIPSWTAYACAERSSFGRLHEALLITEHLPEARPFLASDRADESLVRAALETAAHLHRIGLPADPNELFALRGGAGWRVLRAPYAGRFPDRPVLESQAAREREALGAVGG